MKLILSAPFRTHFNLKSDQIIAHPEILKDLAQKSFEELPKSLADIISWQGYSSINKGDDLIFSSLNDETKLFGAYFIKLKENRHFDELLEKSISALGFNWTINPKETAIYLCDNSIGLAHISITLDKESIKDPKNLDQDTGKLAQHFVKEIQRKYVEDLCQRIYQIASKQKICLVQEPNKFETMHDINAQKDFVQNSCLWASRIFCSDKATADIKKFLNEWTVDAEDALDQIEEQGSAIFLGWGNNFCIGMATFERVSAFAIHHMNYYYSVFDIVNRNMTFLFSVLSFKQSKKALQEITHNANYIASNIDLLIILFEDELQNLQGKDREFANTLFYAWSMQVLSESIQNKVKLINDKISYLNQAQMARSQKSMDAMITFLGGLAIVELTLVLAEFSNSEESNDHFYGVIDLVKSSEPDFLISVTFIIVILLTVLNYFLSKRQN